MASKIGSITLWVSSVERSLEFFRKADILPGYVSPDAQFAQLKTEGCRLQLHAGGKPSPLLLGAMHIDLEVQDVDRTYLSWKKRGIVFRHPPKDMPWGERSAYFSDPDGYVFEISGPLRKTKKLRK